MSGGNLYWRILRRRWWLVGLIFLLVALASGYQFAKARRQVGYQACVTLYVSDVSSPSLNYSTSGATDVLLAGETAANFFADDVLDVAQSQRVAGYLSREMRSRGLPSTTTADINGAVSGSRKDRTVNLCVTNPHPQSALDVSRALGYAMQNDRARFVGKKMAQRTYVHVVSDASVARAPSTGSLTSFFLRLILGLLVALGAGVLWDVLDPRVRDRSDFEDSLDLPVLASFRPG